MYSQNIVYIDYQLNKLLPSREQIQKRKETKWLEK